MKGLKKLKFPFKKTSNKHESNIPNAQKVAIAGGTGFVGRHITEAFLQDKSFEVILIARKSSTNPLKSEFAKKGAKIAEVDYMDIKSLSKILRDINVVISVLPASELKSSQSNLIKASKLANVKKFVPSEFGVDIVGKQNPFFLPKIDARKEIEVSGLEYTYYVTGFFMDLIVSSYYGFDLNGRSVEIIGEGNTHFSITSLNDIAQFVVRTILLPRSRNAILTITGEITTMNKLCQDLSLLYQTNLKRNYISYDQANRRITDHKVDDTTSLFYFLRFDIESGQALNKYDQSSIFNMRPISMKKYLLTHPQY